MFVTAQIILADFKGKTCTSEKRVREQELHRQAVEIANMTFPSVFDHPTASDASPSSGHPGTEGGAA